MSRWRTFGIFLALAVGATLLAGTLSRVPLDKIWAALRSVALWQFGIFLLVSLLNLTLQVTRWRMLLRAQNVRLPFRRLLEIRLAAFAMTYLTPLADLLGEGVRAYLLSRENVRPPLALAAAASDRLIEWTTHIALTLLVLAAAAASGALPFQRPTLLIALAAVISLVILVGAHLAAGRRVLGPFFRMLRISNLKTLKNTARSIDRFEDILADYLVEKRPVLGRAMLLSSLISAITFVEVWLVVSFLGYQPTLTEIVIVQTMLIAVYAVPGVANVGVGDLSGAAIFGALGMDAVRGVAFAFVVRAKDLLIAGAGLASLLWLLKGNVPLLSHFLASWLSQKNHGSTS
ncbi:flippase-like domain-containing protein [Candidatus Parcubacteria bacterium]|nr:flippase-like domain-containing protein [Candidatus Parcubacteria bacterium]